MNMKTSIKSRIESLKSQSTLKGDNSELSYTRLASLQMYRNRRIREIQ